MTDNRSTTDNTPLKIISKLVLGSSAYLNTDTLSFFPAGNVFPGAPGRRRSSRGGEASRGKVVDGEKDSSSSSPSSSSSSSVECGLDGKELCRLACSRQRSCGSYLIRVAVPEMRFVQCREVTSTLLQWGFWFSVWGYV